MIDEREDFTGVGIKRGEDAIVGVILLEDTRDSRLQAGINMYSTVAVWWLPSRSMAIFSG